MATFAVDSKRQQMVATGVVEPVMEWVDTPEGKRRPGDNQARQEGTGVPLWGVEVVYQSEQWGRVSTESVKVTVPAQAMPAPSLFTPIQFTDLVASVRVIRANGGLSTSWEAGSIAEMADSAADTRKAAA
ncbi:hypothetical protein AB1046_17655 [Promicromonospora sp. Populi]|uniref:hypothetical protein n=1 Tax=Promicromonospora sp. Populi TaxID=3239420 RepID=UPI0034E1DB2E